jgi:hypothetical protein
MIRISNEMLLSGLMARALKIDKDIEGDAPLRPHGEGPEK